MSDRYSRQKIAAETAAAALPYGPFIPPAALVGWKFLSNAAFGAFLEARAYRDSLRLIQNARPMPPKAIRRQIAAWMRYRATAALKEAKREAVQTVLFYAEREGRA